MLPHSVRVQDVILPRLLTECIGPREGSRAGAGPRRRAVHYCDARALLSRSIGDGSADNASTDNDDPRPAETVRHDALEAPQYARRRVDAEAGRAYRPSSRMSDPRPERTDVVVIGCGAIGASVAYHLAREGIRVTVVDRDPVGSGASSANPGTVSLATKKPGLSLALARAAQLRFLELSSELSHDVEYEQCGTLIVAESEDELTFLADLAARQRAGGARVEIVDSIRARQICTLLNGSVVGGSYCATDGQVNPFQVTYGFARAAERHGAKIMPKVAVTGIELHNGRVRSVTTDHGSIRADWVINATGAFADDVAAMVGVRHGVVPRRGQVLVLAAEDELPPVKILSTRQLLAKHRADGSAGRLSFGYAWKPRSRTVILGSTNESVGFDRRTSEEGIAWIAGYATRVMPALAELPVLRMWAGLRPYREGGPIVGRAGGPGGYIAATGHAGDGIALSPVTGAHVADVVVRGAADLSTESFIEPVLVAD